VFFNLFFEVETFAKIFLTGHGTSGISTAAERKTGKAIMNITISMITKLVHQHKVYTPVY